MKKLINYIAQQVWNEVGVSLKEGITEEESLKATYKVVSEIAGEDFAEQLIKNLLEAEEEEKKDDSSEEGDGGEDKEFDDKEQLAMMTQAERDAITEKIDDKLLKTKLTNPTTGNKNQVSTLLGKKKSDRPAYNVAAKFLKKQGVSDEDIEGQSNTQQGDSEPKEAVVDRSNFDKKEKEHLDNPNGPTRKEILDDLNSGNLDVLDEYQTGVQSNREKGVAGMGGAVASEGESKYCDATNTDFDKWDEDNKEAISQKQSEFDRNKSADEVRTAKALGLDPSSDEFNNYLAKREVWTQQQLEKVKSDTDSVFYKKGRKGFGGKDEPYNEWMKVAYDGAQTTQRVLNESNIDTSKPHRTVQSTAEVDQAVQAHLEDAVKNAKSPEDKKKR